MLQLQVVNTNPAQRLYTRLGFIKTGETNIHANGISSPGGGNRPTKVPSKIRGWRRSRRFFLEISERSRKAVQQHVQRPYGSFQ